MKTLTRLFATSLLAGSLLSPAVQARTGELHVYNWSDYVDESVLEDGEVICPNCGEKLEFDMSSLEEDSDDDQE